MLILLDNAATATQVRPLLPATPTCVVVVTSRSRLSGLAIRNGATLVSVDTLSTEDALLLLRRVVGEERVGSDLAVARRLVQLCGRLPLAIRVVGERIGSNPDGPLDDVLFELEDERARIDALSDDEDDGSAIRTVFSWSYKALPPPDATMFRMLGLHAGARFSTAIAAVLAGTSIPKARRLLEHLANAHLVTRVGRDRYSFHDLLRAYAAELAGAEESAEERRTVVGRAFAWYLHAVDATDRIFAPSRRRVPLDPRRPNLQLPVFTSQTDALSWCEIEHANLVGVMRQAGEYRFDAAWQLAAVLGEYLFQRKHWAAMITTHRIGLDAAQRCHNRLGVAWMLTNLGTAHVENEQFGEAAEYCGQALEAGREIGEENIDGHALTNLGLALAGLHRLPEAVARQREAQAVHRATGNQWGEAWSTTCLGRALVELGQFGEAIECYRVALPLHELVDNKWANGSTLTDLGVAYLHVDQLEQAADALTRAIAIHDEADNLWGKATALEALGDALARSGQGDAAAERWRCALEILRTLGAPNAGAVEARLGTVNVEETRAEQQSTPSTSS
jgi:tetratricopeptide (TPR) repeat protein